ncbi:MAG: hypothetical protein ACE144_19635 [Thermodesulfobacteriota bacterium]
MDKEQYEAAKARLEEITMKLKYETLSPPERERLEKEGKELAIVVMSPWIPFDWRHRMIMMIIAAIGFWGLAQGQYLFMLVWLLLPLFSPRIVGMILGAITGFKDW